MTDTEHAKTVQDAAPPAEGIYAVSVKLSPFSTQAPTSCSIWFRRAEIQFRLRRISDPYTKADYVLEAMPEDIFTQISSWLDDFQVGIKYDDLKSYLLREFTLTHSARAQKLLAFSKQPLGDRSTHTVWNEMQALARLPTIDPVTGQHRQVDLMRELWLQTLPSAVRAALPDAADLPMSVLIETADKLIDATKASLSPSHIGAVADFDHELHAVFKQQHYQNRKRFDAKILPSGLCIYHSKFGPRARNCVPGCQWSKNA